jgi:hypothetical protein
MSQIFSEIHKINNVWTPALGSSGAAAAPGTTDASYETDILNMSLYKHCTFVISAGAIVEENHINVKVMACVSATEGGYTVPIDFYYRSQGSGVVTAYTTDTPSALTAGTSDGFDTSSGGVGAIYIVEVDAPNILAEGATYEHVKLYIQGSTQADDPRNYSIIAILSEPRYPQAVLNTCID